MSRRNREWYEPTTSEAVCEVLVQCLVFFAMAAVVVFVIEMVM